MNIVIVDYGMGNLKSVYNAFSYVGCRAKVSTSPSEIENADKLVLPGVGAFEDAMKGLEEKQLTLAVKKFIASGKFYLGICLGLQILFEESEEGKTPGLAVFKGKVRCFRKKKGLKIPHIGWNSVLPECKMRPMEGIKDGSFFYFVHSYYAEPSDKKVTAAVTEYGGIKFSSMVFKDNVFATQFHPERSQSVGLKFIKNFVEM